MELARLVPMNAPYVIRVFLPLSSAATLGWALVACAPAPTPPARLTVATVEAARVATPAAPPTSVVTDVSALEAHLAKAGVALEAIGEQNMVYFDTPARIYRIGEDNLEVHTYPRPDVARLAAGGVAPDGRSITTSTGEEIAVQWLGSPHFYLSGPLLVVYIGNDPAVLAALAEALGPQFAGAPVPGGLAGPGSSSG